MWIKAVRGFSFELFYVMWLRPLPSQRHQVSPPESRRLYLRSSYSASCVWEKYWVLDWRVVCLCKFWIRPNSGWEEIKWCESNGGQAPPTFMSEYVGRQGQQQILPTGLLVPITLIVLVVLLYIDHCEFCKVWTLPQQYSGHTILCTLN